jgi:dephospho-CoA kinase
LVLKEGYMMLRTIGITGNIASGKTFVGQVLLELGVERYIDADGLVHRLYEGGQSIALKVAEEFGVGVMKGDGSVDRKALGSIVFRDAEALRRLECIVHPAVAVLLAGELAKVSAGGIAVIDAVKLLEGQSGQFCQSKWLIICEEEQEMARLMARNELSEEEARVRLSAQPPIGPKVVLVDEVIDNGKTREETRRQVRAAFERFVQKNPS